MSKKKESASSTPSDQFTWTDGSSMLLDTFRHDMEEGRGVSEGGRLPQTKGMSSLPPGLLTPEEGGAAPYGTQNYTHDGGAEGRVAFDLIDLNTILASDSERLPALDWLEIEDTSDPGTLPTNPIDIIPELEEAWGVRRRTDGVTLDNPTKSAVATRLQSGSVDLDYVREDEFEGRKLTKAQVRKVKRFASRKIAAGEDLRSVIQDVEHALGEEYGRVRKHMAKLEREEGLLGNVYIKASSYPNCDQGDWTDHVQKTSPTAKYVVAGRKCSGCVFSAGGSCSIFGRSLVASVPWEEAREEYRPYFQNDGIRVASGDPKKTLKKAFAQDPNLFNPIQTEFVEDTANPFERLDARLSSTRKEEMEAELAETRARQAKLKRQKLAAWVHKLASTGSITEKQAESLLTSKAKPRKVYKKAQKMVVENQLAVGDYQGVGEYEHTPADYTYEKRATRREVKAAVESTNRWLNEGLSGPQLDQLIDASLVGSVRNAADKSISQLRSKHEGLAGHLYVVAEAYGNTSKGCEEGARRHRQQDIPYVHKMAACEGCVFRNQHDNCTKYAKELVSRDDFKESELRVFRDRMVELTNMSDQERSASFFAPTVDPREEFDLQNSPLEDFDFHKEASPQGPDVEEDVMGEWFDL